jgi:hypothetical protein
MDVNITNKEVSGVSVVALDGRIVLGEESNSLRESVKRLVGQGKKKDCPEYVKRHIYRQRGIGHAGSRARQRQKSGRSAACVQFGQ